MHKLLVCSLPNKVAEITTAEIATAEITAKGHVFLLVRLKRRICDSIMY